MDVLILNPWGNTCFIIFVTTSSEISYIVVILSGVQYFNHGWRRTIGSIVNWRVKWYGHRRSVCSWPKTWIRWNRSTTEMRYRIPVISYMRWWPSPLTVSHCLYLRYNPYRASKILADFGTTRYCFYPPGVPFPPVLPSAVIFLSRRW